MQTNCLQMLDAYWNGVDKPKAGGFDLWPEWLFQYYNELTLGEDNVNVYIM